MSYLPLEEPKTFQNLLLWVRMSCFCREVIGNLTVENSVSVSSLGRG